LRLSLACVGIPGDEIADTQLICNEWVRATARKSAGGTKSLLLVIKTILKVTIQLIIPDESRIRLGTFNVNGKFPSQDLSSWVGGRPRDRKDEKQTPPQKVPFEEFTEKDAVAADQAGDSQCDVDETTTLAESIRSTASTITASVPQTARVDPTDPEDPDMLVLGFQEVDLSTEALLYSVSTAREDAWCLAVFAGLGEKRDSYQKVCLVWPLGYESFVLSFLDTTILLSHNPCMTI
jgi:phosphatidylinositol-bisphosphatase